MTKVKVEAERCWGGGSNFYWRLLVPATPRHRAFRESVPDRKGWQAYARRLLWDVYGIAARIVEN